MAEARQRAARAADRALALGQLKARLAGGNRITDDELEHAREAADMSAESARAARSHDREEHLRSAEAHRRAAALYQQQGQSDKADEHFTAAEADEKLANEP